MQEKRGKIKEITRIEATGPKTKSTRGTAIVMTSSLAKKARSTSIAGFNSACSNGRSRKNKCRNSISHTEGRVYPTKPIHHGSGLYKYELL